jgi:muramoyltetrapeptide carboxypeptidase
LVVVEVADVSQPHGYLAAPDAVRIAQMNALLRRDDVDALIAVRGGYGALRILPSLDYDAARAHPKLLVGYSDLTALHLALYHKAGWRGISGPMAAVEWADADADSERLFWEIAQGGTPVIAGPGGEALRGMKSGEAEGVLLGGNLTLVTKLLGTPYLPSLDGAILFLEEIGEAPYRLDGLLAQLRLSGVLARLGGLVYGSFTEAEDRPGKPTLSLESVLEYYAQFVGGPVAHGLVYGHIARKSCLPVGVRARLEAHGAEARLEVLEPVAAARG